MAAEEVAKFRIDGDSFTFCGGSGVEQIDEESQSLIGGILKNLTIGGDAGKLLVPTFFLEPRSMLEKMTDLFAHPQLFTAIAKARGDVQRLLAVTRWYMSSWHLRPIGCKKPFNPVLGEKFFCFWDLNDAEGSRTEFVGEQVSHHPPISAFAVENRKHNLALNAHVHAKAKYTGNSMKGEMYGEAQLYPTDQPDQLYTMTFPTIYANGLLIGKLRLELGGDPCFIRCESTGLEVKIEFKEKSMFGDPNQLFAKVRRIGKKSMLSGSSGEILYTIEGRYDKQLMIKEEKTGKVDVFFDAVTTPLQKKIVVPVELQTEFESGHVWAGLTKAILARNYDQGAIEKVQVEEAARHRAAEREEKKTEHKQEYFQMTAASKWWQYKDICLDEYDEDEERVRPKQLQMILDAYYAAKKANKAAVASAWEPILLPPPKDD